MGETIKTQKSRIFVAGSTGLVGRAICRNLQARGYQNVLTPSHKELDLTEQTAVSHFFSTNKIDGVFLAAARVGGILANDLFSADFLYENLMIEANVIHSAHKYGVKKLIFLGSSCIYPRLAPQPIREEYLLTGTLEKTNEAYALAKIAGLKLCEMYHKQYGSLFSSVMPTNLYGPFDFFHPDHSHVIPGLIRRFHEAKVHQRPSVVVWGTGTPLREFLHVDDLAEALVFLYENLTQPETLNIGSGEELSIRDLSYLIKTVVGYEGEIVFDPSKPDGTPRKLLDSTRMRDLGWVPRIRLEAGLRNTYEWALNSRVFDKSSNF